MNNMNQLRDDLNSEIQSADVLLRSSWKSDYRQAYLEGKMYAYKKILEQLKRGKYTQGDEH